MKIREVFLALLAVTAPAAAQSIGIGGGFAVPSAQIAQLPESVRNEGWSAEERASTGYYLELRVKPGLGLPLVAAISYNRFLDQTLSFDDGSGRTASVMSSQIIVPASAGIEVPFSDGIVASYGTAEVTGSYFYRSFEAANGGVPLPFHIESEGDARFGAAFGLGGMIDLPLIRFDASARVQLVNLLNREEGEEVIYFAQFGGTIFFGL